MKKRPVVALINSSENTGAQVITNATSREWSVVKTAAGLANLLGPFRYGKGVRVEYFDSALELRQHVVIGASTSKETIVAATKYSIKIGNSSNSYESQRQQPVIFTYLFGTVVAAATDRATVYAALASKINAYSGLNAKTYTLTYVPFTSGGSVGDTSTTYIVGEAVDTAGGATAKVAKCTITSGTFAGDNAAGDLWIYDVSAAFLEGNVHIHATANSYVANVSSNCISTMTGAAVVHNTGLCIVDDAGYFTSNKERGGISGVYVSAGFTTDTAVVSKAGQYGLGQGTAMLALKPIFDPSNQDLVSGSLAYDIQNGELPTAGKTYCKCVIVTRDGDETSLGATLEDSERESILYFDETTADHVSDIKVALSAAILL